MKSGTRLVLLVIAAILLALVVAMVVVVARDFLDLSEPPDDSDLQLTYTGMPDDENAYLFFTMCAREIREGQWAQIKQLRDTGECDPTFAADFLAQNTEAVDLYREALACTRGERTPPELTVEPDPFLVDIVELGKFEALAGSLMCTLRANGKEKQAFDEAIALMRFGDVIKKSKGGYQGLLCGQSMQRLGRNLIAEFLADTTLSSEELEAYIDQIKPLEDDAAAVADAWRCEYADALRYVDDVIGPGGLGRRPLTYKPNKTKNALVDYYRQGIENADRVYAQVPLALTADLRDESFVQIMQSDTIDPHDLAQIIGPMDRVLGPVRYARSELSALRVLIALKCHKQRTGELPATLDELVPEYFEKIPMDYFDGGPIKYDRDKKLLYCVGIDLEDTGGTEDTEEKKGWNAPDPAWRIEF